VIFRNIEEWKGGRRLASKRQLPETQLTNGKAKSKKPKTQNLNTKTKLKTKQKPKK
jgi:hypothetical protein